MPGILVADGSTSAPRYSTLQIGQALARNARSRVERRWYQKIADHRRLAHNLPTRHSMALPDDIVSVIDNTVARVKDHPVLLIQPPGTDYQPPDETLATPLRLSDDYNQARDLVFERRYRLAVVVDAPTVIGRDATRRMLAHLRNVGAHGVLAVFGKDAGEDWAISDFLALGFRRAEQTKDLASPYWIYRYNIFDYKITPDWLNSRYWANPEQWDQERW